MKTIEHDHLGLYYWQYNKSKGRKVKVRIIDVNCTICNKLFSRADNYKKARHITCSKACLKKAKSGSNHSLWKG
jgi:hypothetical protein